MLVAGGTPRATGVGLNLAAGASRGSRGEALAVGLFPALAEAAELSNPLLPFPAPHLAGAQPTHKGGFRLGQKEANGGKNSVVTEQFQM